MRWVGIIALIFWAGTSSAANLTNLINTEKGIATERLMANISPAGTAPGTVLASPSRYNPDYYYHWVRDAALVMREVIHMYQDTSDPTLRAQLAKKMSDYISIAHIHQTTPTQTGLGEPKFLVNGRVFSGPWGRPQNDGPALRALTLMRWARILIRQGKINEVRQRLYDNEYPARTVIKMDLEYVSHHWQDPSFDLWEEVLGDHFYTRMADWEAMREGAQFASDLGDPGAAAWYQQQATQLKEALADHFSIADGQINATLNWRGGLNYKASNLDSSVVLAFLHTGANPSEFVDGTALLAATMKRLAQRFAAEYPINANSAEAPAIGRYPEDSYYGGNPWYLTTLAFAEYNYDECARNNVYDIRLGTASAHLLGFFNSPDTTNNPHCIRGDQYMQQVFNHMPQNGHLSEQFNRTTGQPESANDLSWSYAAFLSAARARSRAEISYSMFP